MQNNTPAPRSSDIEDARLALNKGAKGNDLENLLTLAKSLKSNKAFNYARRIFALASVKHTTREKHLKILQQWALCTGKDVDLPANERFERAVKILNRPFMDLENTDNQETLGITGGIYKRHWEVTSDRKFLEISLHYYDRGYAAGIANNDGYCAINAAFIYDLIEQNELKDKTAVSRMQEKLVQNWKEQAKIIRESIIAELDQVKNDPLRSNWWLLVTLAEAKFGLGRFQEAKLDLQKAMEYDPDGWELETTTRQLARLAMMQQNTTAENIAGSQAWDALTALLKDPKNDIGALQGAFEGKIGLALSGGGFRASLYHIGVLARLAELDVLRKVEVLSCVSGGSIIGAYYYLKLRHLLQTTSDANIVQEDYIKIVTEISTEFLSGVQRNIRMRVLSDWWSNFKMMFVDTYSRTNKLASLYEEELFSKVTTEKWLDGLLILPMKPNGKLAENFTPKYDNRLRNAKVPILILNATTLNTGHNWQFTASWMGESPATIQKIDGNYRLRRMYYKPTGEEKLRRRITLGEAVAASSCVPGMFEPITFPNFYEGKKIRLVDGGVHDNQGICGLLEQDCEVMLISDASGQMSSIDDPSRSILGVPMRANDILMERVRNAQYQDMKKRLEAGLLKGLLFIHLKMDLPVATVDWKNCEDPVDHDCNDDLAKITPYNIRKDLQAHLAAIRTDLDSFHDTEAHALMTSGYLMTKEYFQQSVHVKSNETKPGWNFLTSMENDLKRFDLEESVIDILKVSKNIALKIWLLSKPLKIVSKILKIVGGAAIVAMLALGILYWDEVPVITVGQLSIKIAFILLGLFLSKWIINLIRYKQTLTQFGINLAVVSIGALVAWIHVNTFDKMYLKKGKRTP